MKKFKLILCMLLVVAIASAAFIGCSTPSDEDVPPVELSQETKLAKENALSLVKWYNVKNGLAENADPLSGAVVLTQDGNTDWLVIGLKAINATADYAAYKKVLDAYIDEQAALAVPFDKMKVTDFQRIALAYYAAGGDPNFVGASKTDIFARATNLESSKEQGINGISYGLIALNMVNTNKTAKAEDFIKSILAKQNSSGGYAGDWDAPNTANADLNAIVIQALAPYYKDSTSYTYKSEQIKDDDGNGKTITKTIGTAIDEMVDSVKTQLDKDGNIAGTWGASVSSSATVVVALSAIGKDVYTDPDFTKKDGEKTITLFDGIAKFKTTDGGYRYTYLDEEVESDFFSAKDVLLAFSAYYTHGAKASSVYGNLRNAAVATVECKNILGSMGDLVSGYEKYVPANGILVQQAFVDVLGKSTAESVIKEVCSARGIKLDISGGYISGINNLTEKSCGKNSGWLFKVNNALATTGVSSAKMKSGDVLSLHFTVTNGDVK